MMQSSPKVAPAGVAFNVDPKKALNGPDVRQWQVDIRDDSGHLVRSLAGDGNTPKNLAWDMRDSDGRPVPRDKSYKYGVTLRDINGHAVTAEGVIAREIHPREMLASSPKYDAAAGALLFTPKSTVSVGVKEWKLNIRGADGTIIKTLSGTGAIPKTLAWKPTEMMSKAGGVNLASSKQVQAIQYDLEFKDASGQQKVLSDQVRFAMGKVTEQSYHLPVPAKEFKVNRGHEVLVASLPNLTAANISQARSAPFVMPIAAGAIRSWKFEVTDPRGRLVRTFKGDAQVPDTIFWDGRDENGAAVPDAERSRFSFWVMDKSGKEIKSEDKDKKIIRNPFTISGAQGKIRKISGLWFRFLDSDIQEAIIGKLREIAQTLRKNPNVQVTIQGHSWDEGSAEEILRLSQERADAVLRFFIEEEGISPKNISSIGYGDTMPLVPAKTAEAAERNRRVEVVIISK
jgi:outer membrane protein OmpA-like peptidoglycan-associated protein